VRKNKSAAQSLAKFTDIELDEVTRGAFIQYLCQNRNYCSPLD